MSADDEVDRSIDGGASPRQLRRAIPDAREAASRYARRVGERHSFESASGAIGEAGACAACAAARATVVAQFRWNATWTRLTIGPLEAILFVAFDHLSWRREAELFGFETHHAVCGPCLRRLRPRPILRGAVTVLSMWVIIICALVGPTALAAFFFLKHGRGEGPMYLVVAAVGWAGLLVGLAAKWRLGRPWPPRALRRVVRRPFLFHSAVCIDASPAPGIGAMNEITRRQIADQDLTWQMTLCVLLSIAAAILLGMWQLGPDAAERRAGGIGLAVATPLAVIFFLWHRAARGRDRRA